MPLATLAAVALAALVGCGEPSAPPSAVEAVLAVSAPTVAARVPVDVTITLTNRGPRARRVTVNACPPPFEVIDGAGAVVGPSYATLLCALSQRQVVLAPGATYVLPSRWAAEGRAPDGALRWPLPPGTYRLRPLLGAEGGLVTGEAVEVRVVE